MSTELGRALRPSTAGWVPGNRRPLGDRKTDGESSPARAVRLSVVICDARVLFAEALTLALTTRGARTRMAADPDDAMTMLDEEPADRVVMSMNLPSVCDAAVIGRILDRWPATQLFCTAAHTPAVDPVVRSRARGVFSTRRPLHELVEGILRPDGAPAPCRPVEFASSVGHARRRNAPEPLAARFLSKREREVLGLLVSARSTTDIAGELGISVTTTRGHIRSIFFKLGVRSRIEAVGYAIRHSVVVA